MAPNSFQSPPRLKVVALRDDSLHTFAPFQAGDFFCSCCSTQWKTRTRDSARTVLAESGTRSE